MARRRSRKNADAPRRPAVVDKEAGPASGEAGEAPAAPASPPVAAAAKEAPKRPVAPGPAGHAAAASLARPAPGRLVRLSTCIAGMVLTLVLGLYVGTLLPGVLQDMRGRDTAPAPQPMPADAAPGAAPRATPQPAPGAEAATHGLPPELAARLASLEAAVRKDPSSADNWTELGNLFFDAGRVGEAIHAYERSLALAPGNADVLTDLGIMYRENKAPEKAVECFRKAFAADPRHENALFNAGVVLYNDLGRKDEALAAWRRLLTLNPQARAPDGRTVSEMVLRLEEPLRRQ